MKKTKNRKKILLGIAIVLLAALLYIWIASHHVWTELDYCKGIGRKLGWLNLDYMHCYKICEREAYIGMIHERDEYIQFNFDVEHPYMCELDDFYIEDIAKIRDTLTAYLAEHPDNPLNQKRITVYIDTGAGMSISFSNYTTERRFINPVQFAFINNYSFDINKAEAFQDAYRIGLKVRTEDDLKLLENWDNLQFLWLDGRGMELTEEQQQYLREILPGCKVKYGREWLIE